MNCSLKGCVHVCVCVSMFAQNYSAELILPLRVCYMYLSSQPKKPGEKLLVWALVEKSTMALLCVLCVFLDEGGWTFVTKRLPAQTYWCWEVLWVILFSSAAGCHWQQLPSILQCWQFTYWSPLSLLYGFAEQIKPVGFTALMAFLSV